MNGTLRTLMEMSETSVDEGTTTVSVTQDALDRAGRYPRLHGQAGSMLYTLDDCIRTHWSGSPFALGGTEKIRVAQVLKGALFEADQPIEASGLTFRLPYLSDWIGATGITEEFADGGGAPATIKVEGRERPPESSQTQEGTLVALRHGVGVEGDGLHARTITQDYSWRLDSTTGLLPVSELMERAGELQALLCLATGRAAEFDHLTLWHPDLTEEWPPGQKSPIPIQMRAQWTIRTEPPIKRLYEHDLFFTYEDLGGINGVSRWLDTAQKHRGVLGRVIGSRFLPRIFITDRLLNCTAALEAFDRLESGTTGSKFKSRINRCMTLAGPTFSGLVGRPADWAEAVRQERDDVAHHLGLAQSGVRTYYVWQSTYYLFLMCILQAAGAPVAVFQRIEQHQVFQSLKPQIQSVI